MEDQVAKAKARKKPVKDAVIQAIEPAAIDEVVKLDDTISYNLNTGKYSFRGQSAKYLSEGLASVSIYKTKDESKISEISFSQKPNNKFSAQTKSPLTGAFLLVFIFECFIVPGRNHLHDFCQVRTIKGNPII